MNSIRQPPQDDSAITHPDQFIRVPSKHELRWGREPYALEEEPDPAIRRVIEEEGARSSSLITAHKHRTPDPLHEMQLLRDMKLVNERTVHELGPLPPGGLPVIPKRKPKLSHPLVPMPVRSEHKHGEDETMKASHAAAATVLVAATTLIACGNDGHAPNAEDANQPASIESIASTRSKHDSSINAQASTPINPLAYRELATAASLDCVDADKGRGCTMRNASSDDRYTVALHPGCGKDRFFGAVNNPDGAELWGKSPPGTAMRATLGKGQVVCIQATAYIEDTPAYYYVTVTPAAATGWVDVNDIDVISSNQSANDTAQKGSDQ